MAVKIIKMVRKNLLACTESGLSEIIYTYHLLYYTCFSPARNAALNTFDL